jgi:hypothetical protein
MTIASWMPWEVVNHELAWILVLKAGSFFLLF